VLSSGDAVPDFKLKNQNGEMVSPEDFRGQKLLIYFYPKADTPGCTKQACSIRDAKTNLSQLKIASIGISPDNPDRQKKFDDKFNLGFPLLSDPDHLVAVKFGVWGEKSMYGKKYMGINRSSFLIDEDGKVIEAWYKVKPLETVPNAQQAALPS
jgi:peroxiredoxin Q/BCP